MLKIRAKVNEKENRQIIETNYKYCGQLVPAYLLI